jgi:hypothetical protein
MYRIVRAMVALSIAGLLVLATAVPAAADSTARPFKGVLVGEGIAVPDASCATTGLRTVMWAAGEVTHLGLTTATMTHCTPPVGVYDIVGGVETLVASNGDTLEMTYTATVEPFEFVDGAAMTGPGRTVITGGTGRFADASGEFVAMMQGILHFTSPMELSWTLDGEIGY